MARHKMGNSYIRTSGWHYKHWKENFYPEQLSAEQWLAYYTEHFKVTEINQSFYKLPGKDKLKNWRDQVPDDFCFSVKANRYITHMKKLIDPQNTLKAFYQQIRTLNEKLGPILFQLPPRWRCNSERLGTFLPALSKEFVHTFEFRDPSWFNDDIYHLLNQHNTAFCIYELAGKTAPLKLTADWVYVRLHGPTETAYSGSYPRHTLEKWSQQIHGWQNQGHDVYCFFDNDEAGYAPKNATALRELLTGVGH